MISGIININKEKGYTSHDFVAKMRGILKIKKIGHIGILDPESEGVLPICIGIYNFDRGNVIFIVKKMFI